MPFRRITASENRFLRMGLYGRAGSGKTRTATEVAIGLALEGEHKAIAFVDTEGNGVDYMQPVCDAAGVELHGMKTRDFNQVVAAFDDVPGLADVLIIDSVSHIWKEVLDTYQREKRRSFLQFQDWGPIKAKWAKLTNAYLTAQFHTIVCGRAGAVYEDKTDADGRREIVQVGTKMKAETEFEHEPSLLVEMFLIDVPGKRPINRAVVLKDRSDKMNGSEIDWPTFASFEPVIRALSPEGTHVALDQSQTAGVLFGSDDFSRQRDRRRRKELEDRVKGAYELAGFGTSKDDKKKKRELFLKHFGTTAWDEVFGSGARVQIEAAENGTRALEAELGISIPNEAAPQEIDDGDDLGF
jgi:hypothetical protein